MELALIDKGESSLTRLTSDGTSFKETGSFTHRPRRNGLDAFSPLSFPLGPRGVVVAVALGMMSLASSSRRSGGVLAGSVIRRT